MSTFGPAYDKKLDGKRIKKQLDCIRDYMLMFNSWWTLSELRDVLNYPESSISAQLRHLRKDRFGGYEVNKRRRSGGTWEYKVERKDNE
jgi:hypothetical protein